MRKCSRGEGGATLSIKTQIPNPNLTLFPLELKLWSIVPKAVELSGKSSALEEEKEINPLSPP